MSLSRSIVHRLIVGMIPNTITGCWVWKGAHDKDGYGWITVDGLQQYAHRLSYRTFNRTLVDTDQVLHRCDNPPCINPVHLFVGSNQDNMNDRKRKGGYNFKLSFEKATEIRRLYATGAHTQSELAKQFGVAGCTVSSVINQRYWTDTAKVDNLKESMTCVTPPPASSN